MRFFRSIGVLTAVFVCGLVVAGVRAQGQQPPAGGRQGGAAAAATNLKVLPKDMTRQQLFPIMQSWQKALGATNCAYCHVEDMANRASDDNPKKEIARKMVQMTMDLNKTLDAIGTPGTPDAPKVTCFTCHRGAAKPLTVPPASGGF